MTDDEFAENPDVDAAGCSGGTEIGSEMKMESTAMGMVPPLRRRTSENEQETTSEWVDGCTKQARRCSGGVRARRAHIVDRRAQPSHILREATHPQPSTPRRGIVYPTNARLASQNIDARCVLRPRRYAAVARLHPTRPARLDTGFLIQGTPAGNSKHDKSGIDLDEAAPRRIIHAGLISTIQNDQARQGIIHPANEDPVTKYTLVDVPPRLAELDAHVLRPRK
ncbi:hypothetical protein B0H13DRAFT_1876979 [Mycena leptocephala]|nr:hypothetical protein B0H13DRAFT_1876979 [Mycena leptocephala]